MQMVVILILSFATQYAVAFLGQPKIIETTYETSNHDMKRKRYYRVNLPDIKLEELQCGKSPYTPPGKWYLTWCRSDAMSSTSCSFKVSEQNASGKWNDAGSYEMVDHGWHHFNSDMFSSIWGKCSNGKINASSAKDIGTFYLSAFSELDYTVKSPNPSPDPIYLFKFCIDMEFKTTADASKHSVLAYRCDKFEYPKWTEVESTIVDRYK